MGRRCLCQLELKVPTDSYEAIANVCFTHILRLDLATIFLVKELNEWQRATGDRIMSTTSQVLRMNCKDELKK